MKTTLEAPPLAIKSKRANIQVQTYLLFTYSKANQADAFYSFSS